MLRKLIYSLLIHDIRLITLWFIGTHGADVGYLRIGQITDILQIDGIILVSKISWTSCYMMAIICGH